MKKFVIVLMLFFCVSASAVMSDLGSVENIYESNFVSDVLMQDNDSREFKQLAEDVIAQYPELGEILEQEPESKLHHVIVYNFLAIKMFEIYKQLFITEINIRSKETGRNIKQEEGQNGEFSMWLDRGDIDDKGKCISQYNGYNICDRPYGYEDYEIEFQDSVDKEYGEQSVFLGVRKDMPDQNKHMWVNVSVHVGKDDEIQHSENSVMRKYIGDTYLSISGMQSRYDEWLDYLNTDAYNNRLASDTYQCTKEDGTEQIVTGVTFENTYLKLDGYVRCINISDGEQKENLPPGGEVFDVNASLTKYYEKNTKENK